MNEEGINNWLPVFDNMKIIDDIDTHCSKKISMRKSCPGWTQNRLRLEERRYRNMKSYIQKYSLKT